MTDAVTATAALSDVPQDAKCPACGHREQQAWSLSRKLSARVRRALRMQARSVACVAPVHVDHAWGPDDCGCIHPTHDARKTN